MKNLALFFTFNISLKIWIQLGLFDREKLIYEEYIRNNYFKTIYWFTYGIDDKKYEKKLIDGIKIIPMPKIFNSKIGKLMYSFCMPFIHKNKFNKIDILKTNQMPGSWSAVIVKMIYRKPLLLRTGYTWSINKKKDIKNRFSLFYGLIILVERIAYKFCDMAEVSSQFQKKYLISKYKINKDKIFILPNYIDLKEFKIRRKINKRKKEIIFVGRLEQEKNLFELIRAVSLLEIRLNIFGSGSLKTDLMKLAGQLHSDVIFCGSVPNKKLPAIYNKYKYFILPSFYEGNPKTLLEAMACGCICLGTDVAGINEVIENNVNGLLIRDIDAESIFKRVQSASRLNNTMISKLSNNAAGTINNRYCFNSIIEKERKIFNKLN